MDMQRSRRILALGSHDIFNQTQGVVDQVTLVLGDRNGHTGQVEYGEFSAYEPARALIALSSPDAVRGGESADAANARVAVGCVTCVEFIAASQVVDARVLHDRVLDREGKIFRSLSNANRRAARIATGDEVDVEVQLDAEPRVVVEPEDFARALEADPAARAAYDRLAYTHKREHVLAIERARRRRRPASAGSRRRSRCCGAPTNERPELFVLPGVEA